MKIWIFLANIKKYFFPSCWLIFFYVLFCRQQREICSLVLHLTTHWLFGKMWSTSHSTSTGLHPTPSMHLIFTVLRLWRELLPTRSVCTPFWTAQPTWGDPPSSAQRTFVGLSQVCLCCPPRGFCCSALTTVPSGCWLKRTSVVLLFQKIIYSLCHFWLLPQNETILPTMHKETCFSCRRSKPDISILTSLKKNLRPRPLVSDQNWILPPIHTIKRMVFFLMIFRIHVI